MGDAFDRPLPSAIEAERAILGGIILEPSLISQAAEAVSAEDFYKPSHRRVFSAMLALFERDIAVDTVLLCGEMEKDGTLESLGGPRWISDLIFGLPHSFNIEGYARSLRGKTVLRRLIAEHSRGIEEAYEEMDDPQVVLDNAQRGLMEITSDARLTGSAVRSYKEIGQSVGQMFDKWGAGQAVAIPTQIPEIDNKLIYGGLAHGDFIVLAAQTSFGKTAFALQVSLNTARSSIPVLIFSLEMKGERLFIRNLASVSNVPRREIAPFTFRHHHQDTIDRINAGRPALEMAPIYVADKVRSLSRLSSVATDWKIRTCKDGRGLIVVDYMQLVQNRMSKRSREEEVAGVSRELKSLASMLDLPVLGLSQFNREPSRSNKRPELKDLRESGAIEQDVDLAMFIWSPNPIGEETVRPVNVYCAKQRDGPTGWDEQIDFDADHQWFRSAQMWRNEPTEGLDFNA